MKKYEKILNRLRREFFLSPNGDNAEKLVELLQIGLESVIKHQGSGPVYPRGLDSDYVLKDRERCSSPDYII
ncbi:MAG: hypothetical protein D6780_07365 [Candidatus Dadabacteria bacterium]|nr:MAG: hypothetical protein D6780_07365 [Candidatus Dadabacteria bacterium]